jgi:Zn-dependent protease
MFDTQLVPLITSFVLVIIALTVHEFAHALAADKLGDPTPRLQGRVTLNPLSHLDPIGTILILFFGFGWGKPVMFDPYNLKDPKRDGAAIAFAGPASNILLAIVSALIIQLLPIPLVFAMLLKQFIVLNISLAIFNLLPIAPLDGFRIVGGMLSDKQSKSWGELEQYGMYFLIALLIPMGSSGSLLSSFLSPIVSTIARLLLY